MKYDRLYYYDENRNPMVEPKKISRYGVFVLGIVNETAVGKTIGLFVEDDDNLFLKCTFNSHWLYHLESAASEMIRNG